MNIYKATIKRGYNSETKELNVLAKDATEAVEFATRYANKLAGWYTSEVIALTKTLEVNVYYKSKPKKRR